MLKVSKTAVLDWIRKGQLPAQTVNPFATKKRYRVHRADLVAFVRAGRGELDLDQFNSEQPAVE